MKRSFSPMAISALLVASMFTSESRPGFSLGRGMHFAPDPPPADPPADDKEKEEEKEPELSEEAKAWFAKQLEKSKTENEALIAKAKEDAKAEAKAEQEKERKAEERRRAKAKADSEGDTAEQIRLANEEKETAKSEAEQARAEAKATKDEAIKIRIASRHKLPDGYHLRLLGSTEKEWETDAAEMAKGLPTTAKKVDLEGGDKGAGSAEEQKKSATNRSRPLVAIF